MKISKDTLLVLKNFSTINASILIPAGNTILTGPPAKNLRAKYVCQEEFPRDFAIYDLPEFLNGISIFTDPDFDFSNDKYVTITEKSPYVQMTRKVKYYYSNPSLIKSPSDKDIDIPDELVIADFVLEHDDIKTILKSSSLYKLPDLTITNVSGDLCVVLRNKADSSKPTFSITVGKTTNPKAEFECNLKLESLKILEDAYRIKVSNYSDKITMAEFISTTQNLSYIIVLEFDSYYKEV